MASFTFICPCVPQAFEEPLLHPAGQLLAGRAAAASSGLVPARASSSGGQETKEQTAHVEEATAADLERRRR